MRTEELAAKLAKWAGEFSSVSGVPVEAPDRLWGYIATRLSELDLSQIDEDVLTVRIMDEHRKVRVKGLHGAFLQYEATDGSVGSGLVPVKDVIPSDRGRLTAILGRLSRSA